MICFSWVAKNNATIVHKTGCSHKFKLLLEFNLSPQKGHYPYSFQIYKKKKISFLQNDHHFYSEPSEELAQNLTANQKETKGHDFHVCLKKP